MCSGDPGVHPAEGSTGLKTLAGAIERVSAARWCPSEACPPKLLAPDQLRRGVLIAGALGWGELAAVVPTRVLATTAEAIVLLAPSSTASGVLLAVQRGPTLKP